jgi:hypothetical protein
VLALGSVLLSAVSFVLALLGMFATNWNDQNWQAAGPFGWQASTGIFVSAILLTGAVVAVTLVGVRLLRWPRSRPGESRTATPKQAGRSGPASPEPAASPRRADSRKLHVISAFPAPAERKKSPKLP